MTSTSKSGPRLPPPGGAGAARSFEGSLKALQGKTASYTLSLPITAAVVGMPKLEHIDANVRMVKSFVPMPPAEMKELAGRLSEKNKQTLDLFFRNHIDA